MERICPACGQRLGEVGNYFCFNCGLPLPKELISETSLSAPNLIVPPFVTREEKSLKLLITIVAVVVLIIVFIVAAFEFANLFKESAQNRITNQKDERIVELGLNLETTNFGKKGSNLASLVPSNVDLYIEGSAIVKFVQIFTSLEPNVQLLKTGITPSKIDSISDGNFAIFSEIEQSDVDKKRSWALLFKTKISQTATIEALKEASASYKLIEDFVVVTDNIKIIEEVESAKKKTSLNLSLNPKYAAARNSLPNKGKIFILITTDSAREILRSLKDENLFNQNFAQVIDILLLSDKNSYVLE